MEFDKNVGIAAKAYEHLENIHSAWVKHLGSLTETFNVGKVFIEKNEVVVETLGQIVRSTHHPVKVDGYLRAIEYAFRVKEDDELPLYVVYLRPNGNKTEGHFYLAPTGGDFVHDSTNTYVVGHLINNVASKLLASAAFEATKRIVA